MIAKRPKRSGGRCGDEASRREARRSAVSRILVVVENTTQATPISAALVEHGLAVELVVGIADGVAVTASALPVGPAGSRP